MSYSGRRRHQVAMLAIVIAVAASFDRVASSPIVALRVQNPRNEPSSGPITFTRDVAPILFEHCATCHRPDGPAPFSLLTYADVRPRARHIAAVTSHRTMPPWKPEPGYGAFVGERRLTDAQIHVIERWVNDGAMMGEPGNLPPLPRSHTGFQLGQPDLVVTLPEYIVSAGGTDVFRNFVVPIPIDRARYVRGLEFHPGSPVVHHANIRVDSTPASRRRDEEDPAPGYEGLILRSADFPDGHFLGWTPGQIAPLAPKGLAWRLAAGGDFVVQLHMRPMETSAVIRPVIGLFFTNDAPVRRPVMIRLGRQGIDIPPGDAAYVTTDEYRLPVDVEVQAVQPHSHYRAREMKAWALLPDGGRRWLIYVKRWDFHWQDLYRYRAPIRLPAGTTLRLEYTFDNSAASSKNPYSPPRRALFGFRSADEMGDLWIQVLGAGDAQTASLARDVRRKMVTEDIVGVEVRLREDPAYAALHDDAALLYLEVGQPNRAVDHFRRAHELQPGSARASFNLGTALEAAGRGAEAIVWYEDAVRLDAAYTPAHNNLGNVLLAHGRLDEAIRHYGDVLRLAPNQPGAHNNLGHTLIRLDRPDEAIRHLREALRLQPDFADAHYNLGHALWRQGRGPEAQAHFKETLRLRPEWPPYLMAIASLLATHPDPRVRRPAEAHRLAARAVDLTGRRDATALDALGLAHAAAGRFSEAIAAATAALAQVSAPDSGELAERIRARLGIYREGKMPTVDRWP